MVSDLNDIKNISYTTNDNFIQIHGNGLFSKEEVTVSISKSNKQNGIVFKLKNSEISAEIANVSSSNRNTALSNGKESICLVEHFLASCSLLGINDIEVTTNTNELIFGDGSAMHYYLAFLKSDFISKEYSCKSIKERFNLQHPIFIKDNNKQIVAIPHNGFQVSYFMDWNHKALGKLWASWKKEDGEEKLTRARSFATKEENDFFGMSDKLLTLEENGFNKKLHEPLEPLYHKILDILGDLRLCGVNPLEINMHVIGFKSGHLLNIEMAKGIKQLLFSS